jgi:hypothetical protein
MELWKVITAIILGLILFHWLLFRWLFARINQAKADQAAGIGRYADGSDELDE